MQAIVYVDVDPVPLDDAAVDLPESGSTSFVPSMRHRRRVAGGRQFGTTALRADGLGPFPSKKWEIVRVDQLVPGTLSIFRRKPGVIQ